MDKFPLGDVTLCNRKLDETILDSIQLSKIVCEVGSAHNSATHGIIFYVSPTPDLILSTATACRQVARVGIGG
jgi:hypothetical protein